MRATKGEQLIITLLRRSGIRFEREKSFTDLRRGKFRYDFYLPDFKTLIEFDGEQHFHQVQHFQKYQRNFLQAQEHDRMKNQYALAHGLFLYRIPYWEFENIKTIKDLFNPAFFVRSQWHNDEVWRRHKKL